ncbi:MAG: hypothetical protein ACK4WD_11025 [Flavobacteriales bacterium]|jgi:hypothetical protein
MKRLGRISLITSVVVFATYWGRYFFIDSVEWTIDNIVLSTILTCGCAAQFLFVQRTSPLLDLQTYEAIETLDNDMAFSENDNVKVIGTTSFEVSLAIIGGVVWLGLVLVASLSISAVFAISLKYPVSILQAIMILAAITGGAPSLIYNLRLWNKKGIAM